MTVAMRRLGQAGPQHNSHFEQVIQLQRKLAGCPDLHAVRALLARALPSLAPVSDRVSLALVEPDGQTLRVYRLLPAQLTQPETLPRVAMAGTVVGQVANDGKARVVADTRAEDNLRFGRASHDGIRSTASVPVLQAGRVVGVFNVGSKAIGACHAAMLEIVADLAAVIGPAVLAVEQAQPAPPPLPPLSGPLPHPEFVGNSPAIQALMGQMRRAAQSDATVLVTGETGVGKTMLARAIHEHSARRRGPFATVHIADLPAALIESELFGHERGAFTGATHRRNGRFEAADGGTLFLDEIGEAPLPVQSKLLRVTQDGCFERVGGSTTQRSDVRIIAATNRDLHQAVACGEFRRDLLYRLEIVSLHIPPLRHRPDDLAPLAQSILARLAATHRRPLRLSATAWSRLHAHSWPGNVREMESVLMRAALLEDGDELELHGLNSRQAGRPSADSDGGNDWPSRDEHERRYLIRVLHQTQGRIEGANGAALLLAMEPSTLRSRLKRLGLHSEAARLQLAR